MKIGVLTVAGGLVGLVILWHFVQKSRKSKPPQLPKQLKQQVAPNQLNPSMIPANHTHIYYYPEDQTPSYLLPAPYPGPPAKKIPDWPVIQANFG